MKKNVIIFTLFAALLITYFVQETKKPKKNSSAGYYPVISKEFSPSQVETISFYPPNKQQEAVVIKRDSGKEDEWRVQSRFNAPAETAKVKKLLDQVKTMEGELRADDPSLLENFELGKEKSYHLVLSGKGGELQHLLIGKKAETFTFGFVRIKGTNKVFLADRDFRYEFGIHGEGATPPDQMKWVNKRILSIKKEEFLSLTLEDKNGSIMLEKEENKGGEEKAGGPHDKGATESWALVNGDSKKGVALDLVKSLVASVASFGGRDVFDITRKKELGLEDPQASLTVTLKGGKKERVFLGSVQGDPEDKHYVFKEGLNLIFEIDSSAKTRIFDKFKEVAGES
ncbi:MAG: DUF4340 domain-containing protein [Nitrospinota bacterium]